MVVSRGLIQCVQIELEVGQVFRAFAGRRWRRGVGRGSGGARSGCLGFFRLMRHGVVDQPTQVGGRIGVGQRFVERDGARLIVLEQRLLEGLRA